MDDFRLSEYERRLLDEIESRLRDDKELCRALRPSRRQRTRALLRAAVPEAVRLPHPAVVAVFATVAVALMVVGISTEAPGVIWAFAVLWPLTAFLAFRLLCRWTTKPNEP